MLHAGLIPRKLYICCSEEEVPDFAFMEVDAGTSVFPNNVYKIE